MEAYVVEAETGDLQGTWRHCPGMRLGRKDNIHVELNLTGDM